MMETTKSYIACDPGKSGGVCHFKSDGRMIALSFSDLVKDNFDMLNKEIAHSLKNSEVVWGIEKVSGYFGRKKSDGSQHVDRGSHMHTFGVWTGMFMGYAAAHGIMIEDIIQVLPKTWQSAYGLKRPRNATDSQWKNTLKDKAMSLRHIDEGDKWQIKLDTSDAVLIAYYIMRYTNARV